MQKTPLLSFYVCMCVLLSAPLCAGNKEAQTPPLLVQSALALLSTSSKPTTAIKIPAPKSSTSSSSIAKKPTTPTPTPAVSSSYPPCALFPSEHSSSYSTTSTTPSPLTSPRSAPPASHWPH